MQQQNYIVYIKADDKGRIAAINSSAFLHDTDGWIKIDEGLSDKYHHAQGNYLDLPLYDEQGCHNWYLAEGKPVQATQEQKAAELAARPVPEPTENERIWQAITDHDIQLMEQSISITDIEIQQMETGGNEV